MPKSIWAVNLTLTLEAYRTTVHLMQAAMFIGSKEYDLGGSVMVALALALNVIVQATGRIIFSSRVGWGLGPGEIAIKAREDEREGPAS